MTGVDPKRSEDPTENPSARRRDVVRRMLHPRQLKNSMALSRQPALHNSALAGLQAAITAAIALPIVYLSPWSHLIGFAALGALVALFGRFAPSRSRILLFSGLLQILTVFAMSATAWLGASMTGQLLCLALACGLFLFVSITGQFGPPGPLIFVFAAGAAMSNGLAFTQVLERTAATTIVVALALVVCFISDVFRQRPSAEYKLPAEPECPLGDRLMAAARSIVGAGIAIFVSHAFGADHPAWAAMGVVAVLQGTHLHITMNRALQRMIGTLAGAVLAWVLLMQEPSVWVVIVLLVSFQFVTEMVIGFNYAFGQVLVTPMALLMTYLGAAQTVGPEMAPERVLDTVLGAIVGIIVAVLFSTFDDRQNFANANRTRSSR